MLSLRHLCPLLMLAACASADGDVPGTSLDATVPDSAMPVLQVHTLVTLGSSSTAGSGASTAENRYVQRLATALGAHLVNLGSGGQTVSAVLDTFLTQALESLDGGPPPAPFVNLVTFLPLTDFARSTPTDIAAGYEQVLARLDPTGAWVVFGIPTLDARYTCGDGGPLRGPNGECYSPGLVADYAAKNTAMREVLARHPHASASLIWDSLATHPEWTAADGHPNDLGHAHIARCFLHTITVRLGADAGPDPGPLMP